MKKKVIIIGLDGASWNILDKMLDKLPNLRKIIDGGCSGNLISTIPYLTPLAWTSAFTGVNPGKHGIFDFLKPTANTKKPVSSSDVKYPYIWETLSRRNMKTLAVSIPFTYPAKELNGIMITGFGAPWLQEGFTFPANFKDELLKQFPNYLIDPQHTFEGNPKLYLKEILEITKQNSKLTKKLISDNPDWDLLITVFSSPDWAQHFFWNDKDKILSVYQIIDEFLGWLLKNIHDENTYIILMSDHGFKGKDKALHINTYLINEGFLKTKKSIIKTIFSKVGVRRRVLKNFDILGLRRFLPSSTKERIPTWESDTFLVDTKNSRAWLSPTAGAGLLVKDTVTAKELEIKLTNLTNPKNGKKIFKKVWLNTDLYWGPYSEESPRLLLIPNKQYEIQNDYSKELITKPDPSKSSASHDLNGIYAVFGRDVSHRKMHMFIWDITPTALALLGIPLYEDMDGKFRKEMFKKDTALYKKEVKYSRNTYAVVKKLKKQNLFKC